MFYHISLSDYVEYLNIEADSIEQAKQIAHEWWIEREPNWEKILTTLTPIESLEE